MIYVIPTTTSIAERTFFSHRYTKSYLRSIIKENRLNELMLLNIHKDIQITSEKAKKNRLLKSAPENYN